MDIREGNPSILSEVSPNFFFLLVDTEKFHLWRRGVESYQSSSYICVFFSSFFYIDLYILLFLDLP
jgi:hypothetical protein